VLLLVVTGEDVAGMSSRAVGERGLADLAAHRRHCGHHDGKGPASRPAARSRMRWHSEHSLRVRLRGRVSDAQARAPPPAEVIRATDSNREEVGGDSSAYGSARSADPSDSG
jgi:hypothetical protein